MQLVKKAKRSGLEERLRDNRLANRRSRSRVVFAENGSSNPTVVLPTYRDHPPVDMAATALEASGSAFIEDQRAGILLALESVIARAVPIQAPEILLALEGLSLLAQIFEGDQSSPLIPNRKSGVPYSSLYYTARAMIMFLSIRLHRMKGGEQLDACLQVAKDVDAAMRPYARIWEIFKLQEPPLISEAFSVERAFAAEAAKINRWIIAESRSQPDKDAMPMGRTAKKQFLFAQEWLQNAIPRPEWENIHKRDVERLSVILLQISREAQSKLSEEEQSTNP